jgi:hypothetical protein
VEERVWRKTQLMREGQERREWKNGACDVMAKPGPLDPGQDIIGNLLNKAQPYSACFAKNHAERSVIPFFAKEDHQRKNPLGRDYPVFSFLLY